MIRISFNAATMVLAALCFYSCGDAVSGGMNSLTLNWAAPTTNEDGSDLVDLCGYHVYYGTASRHYSRMISVGGSRTSAVVSGLSPGTWYMAVTVYDFYGNESAFSNEVAFTFD